VFPNDLVPDPRRFPPADARRGSACMRKGPDMTHNLMQTRALRTEAALSGGRGFCALEDDRATIGIDPHGIAGDKPH
jgi:hypothetical protein